MQIHQLADADANGQSALAGAVGIVPQQRRERERILQHGLAASLRQRGIDTFGDDFPVRHHKSGGDLRAADIEANGTRRRFHARREEERGNFLQQVTKNSKIASSFPAFASVKSLGPASRVVD